MAERNKSRSEMSARQARRLRGGNNVLPPVEGDSDEEFQPQGAKKLLFMYKGLVGNSDSDREKSEEEVAQPPPEPVASTSKAGAVKVPVPGGNKKNNKRKRRARRRLQEHRAEMEELDKVLREVNAMNPCREHSPVRRAPVDLRKKYFIVRGKYLDYKNEFKLKFRSDSTDNTLRGRLYRPHNVYRYQRAHIVPMADQMVFYHFGLDMTLRRREGGCLYFTVDHRKDYRAMHQKFLNYDGEPTEEIMRLARCNYHIEALIEFADIMYRHEEYVTGNSLLRTIISCVQHAAHQEFNLTNQSVRLEYSVLENRPFFIAVLKFVYTLSNVACHRSALEMAKVLMNLDPSDPLGIMFTMDVIALRAREHQWLVDVIEYWDSVPLARYCFNLHYSKALAHFHLVARKKKKGGNYTVPDKLLKEAIMLFPLIAKVIFQPISHEYSHVFEHPLFTENEDSISTRVKIAMTFHAKLACWRWREKLVLEWFYRNVMELVEYLETAVGKADQRVLLRKRLVTARRCPEQILRHLYVVSALSDLVAEWRLPPLPPTRGFDPQPPLVTENRYNYRSEAPVRRVPVIRVFRRREPQPGPSGEAPEASTSEASTSRASMSGASTSGASTSGASTSGAFSAGTRSTGTSTSGVPSAGAFLAATRSAAVSSKGAPSAEASTSGAFSAGAGSSGAPSARVPSAAARPAGLFTTVSFAAAARMVAASSAGVRSTETSMSGAPSAGASTSGAFSAGASTGAPSARVPSAAARPAGAFSTVAFATAARMAAASSAGVHSAGTSTSGASMTGASTSGAPSVGARSTRVRSTGAGSTGAGSTGTSMSGASTSGTTMSGARSTRVRSTGAGSTGTSMSGASTSGTSMSGASTSGTSMSGASTSGTSMSGASTSGARSVGARTTRVRSTGAGSTGVRSTGAGSTESPLAGTRSTGTSTSEAPSTRVRSTGTSTSAASPAAAPSTKG